MNLIFNILLFLLIAAMLVVLLKSPKQIIVNFSKGILRWVSGPFAWIYDSWKESKANRKKTAELKEIAKERRPHMTIEFPKEEVQLYLLIQGDYSEDDVVYDLQIAVQKLGTLKVNYTHMSMKDAQLIQISGLGYLSRFQSVMREMSVLYGRDQTYGYIESQQSAIAVTIDNEHPNLMTGRLEGDLTAFRDGYAMDAHSNVMILSPQIELKSWVSPSFFQQLIKSVKEEGAR